VVVVVAALQAEQSGKAEEAEQIPRKAIALTLGMPLLSLGGDTRIIPRLLSGGG
jgi:hypothetical protein